MKYKLLLLVAILFIYASSCDDDTTIEPFDHAAQAIEDNDSLVKYMQEHFLNADGELDTIASNEPAIYDDANLFEKAVTYTRGGEDISYKLYYYISEVGVNEQPTRVDLANVSYIGMDLDHEVFDRNDYGGWFDLYSGVIAGWSYGIPNFKAGNAIELPDGSFEYSETGKGILFIPSGLAYANIGSGSISANEPIIFYINLNDIHRSDHDEDNVPSMIEDLDNDDDYTNDDTDADGVANFIDSDDDGDGVLTKLEDLEPDTDLEVDSDGDGDPTNDIGDGDPTNDDTDNDGIPNYLDPDDY